MKPLHGLSGVRALVTGGAGFVGSWIVEGLIDAGASRVVVVDDFSRGRMENLAFLAAHTSLEIVHGDICDAALIDRLTDGIDLVFHQAALRITECADDPVRAMNVLVGGTQNVLQAAVRNGVVKVVLASSASVYGEPDSLPILESAPFNNRSVYGAGKIANEQLARAYAEMYGLRYLALRPFNVYGPRMDASGAYTEVLIRWLERLSQGRPPMIFGDGSQTMDFVFVGDVAHANLLAALSDATDEVINVGTGIETSLNELCGLLCEVSGHAGLDPVYAEARRVNGVTRRQASIEHAHQLIGFEAEVALRAGLRELVGWYEALADVERVAAR